MKTHCTIVCGWDKEKNLIYMRTFDFENSETEKKLAFEAQDYVSENCAGWMIADISTINVIEKEIIK